ncbi:MAG TPA: alpha/beta hydrolase [Verrucomicrobiae bacterium]|nr:alpha/beta hydrolase [Verrucomicrobiae bacterium]
MSAVEFASGGERIAAVHLAGEGGAFAGARGTRPCVVLAHGFAGTVDSGIEPYAERFAAAGLDALAFDYRHFGASAGEPRQLVSVPRQLEDYAAAIAYARGLQGVDPERIVLWGTSFSGGHVVEAAVSDGRVAAVIAQSPAMDGLATMLNAYRYAGAAILARFTLDAIRDALGALQGRPPLLLPVVGAPGTLAAMSTPDAEPGYRAIAGPSWRNEFAARYGLTAARYRPGRKADRLPCPMLVQIADRDSVAPPAAAQDAAWRATGRAEVRTYPVGHFDVYVGDAFERSVSDQLHFLTRHLTPLAAESDIVAHAG